MQFVGAAHSPAAFDHVAEVDHDSESEQGVSLQRLLKNCEEGGEQTNGILFEVDEELVGLVASGWSGMDAVEVGEAVEDGAFVDGWHLVTLHLSAIKEMNFNA